MIINKDNILTYLSLINDTQQKGELFSYVTNRLKGKKAFFKKDVYVKNDYGIFNCGRIMENCKVACTHFEKDIREEFNISSGVFVDIGAHIGKHTIYVAKKHPFVKVLSFEPDPETYKLLKENIVLNGLDNVNALNMACSDISQDVTLWKSKEHPATNSIEEEIHDSSPIIVHSNKLDNLLKTFDNIALIKIDAEGAEERIIKGAMQILLAQKPKIIFEASTIERLIYTGYLLSIIGYSIRQIDEYNYVAESTHDKKRGKNEGKHREVE